jgi:5-methylthioadenosine/S-adenosylhomocysteine deaminase
MTEEVDILIKNTSTLNMTEERTEMRHVDIAITNGKILGIAPNLRYDAKEEIDGSYKMFMPGLVDTHTHAFQIFLRGALSSKELNVHPLWLKILIPFEADMQKEEGRVSAELACLNMIKKGITAFADAGGPYPDQLAEVAYKAGLRARITSSTFDRGPESYNRDMRTNLELARRWKNGRVIGWFSIRQIMISSDQLIFESFAQAKKEDTGLHIHLNEEVAEVDHALTRWGMRPFEYLHEKGLLSQRVIAAHCAFLSDYETQIIAQDSVSIAHCPMAAMTYMAFPKVPRLLRMGANVALGTDGGSYRGLDMFVDMNVALASHIGYFGTPYFDFNVISTLDLLKMACVNGYRAIMQKDGGVLEGGRIADIISVNLKAPHLRPMKELEAIPLFATGDDVSDMIVDGKIVMRERKVLTMDEDEILNESFDFEPKVYERIKKIVKR